MRAVLRAAGGRTFPLRLRGLQVRLAPLIALALIDFGVISQRLEGARIGLYGSLFKHLPRGVTGLIVRTGAGSATKEKTRGVKTPRELVALPDLVARTW